MLMLMQENNETKWQFVHQNDVLNEYIFNAFLFWDLI